MDMYRWPLLFVAALLLSGCVAIPQQKFVKEVHVCDAEDCTAANHKYSAAQLLAGFQQLLKANAGEKVTICDSDSKTRACESVGFCYLVLGGMVPGNGCSKSIVFNEVAVGNQPGQLAVKADMPLTFIWTPIACTTMTGILSVRSADEISIEFQPYYCNWMAVGNMSATFNFAAESLDLKHGKIGGYLSHAVKGTGNGRGSGYAVMEFPKVMPGGEDWLVAQPAFSLPQAHVSGAE